VSPRTARRCRCAGKHAPTTEATRQQMMDTLYRAGFGYHQIADLARVSHEEVYQLLTHDWPAWKHSPGEGRR